VGARARVLFLLFARALDLCVHLCVCAYMHICSFEILQRSRPHIFTWLEEARRDEDYFEVTPGGSGEVAPVGSRRYYHTAFYNPSFPQLSLPAL